MRRMTVNRFKALIILTIFLSASIASAEISGNYGYVIIQSASPGAEPYTWKEEVGTLQFQGYTVTTNYKESASYCPNENWCKPSDSSSFSYSMTSPKIAEFKDAVLVFSDDYNYIEVDGALKNHFNLAFAVKLDPTKSFSASEINGDYFTIFYERDFYGESSGYHRLGTLITTLQDGSISGSGKLACNGNECQDGYKNYSLEQGIQYQVKTGGVFAVKNPDAPDFLDLGYVSQDGKLSILAFPTKFYPDFDDDFQITFSMKRGDKSYSKADFEGKWIYSIFGDDQGKPYAGFGTMGCDAEANCQFNIKVSKGGIFTYMTKQATWGQVSADGSINGFYVAEDWHTGAIGANGNIILFTLSNKAQRQIGVAIKSDAVLGYGSLAVKNGWNLLGLVKGAEKSIQELTSGKEDKLTSIWKWSSSGKWAVYLPKYEKVNQGASESYANSKGFEVISTINPGEGFWVNAELGDGEILYLE